MLPESPPHPSHRVYMIHYSNAHTPRISLADGKHTGLAFISKSTIYFIIVSQSAVKFRNALDMRSLQSILCLFTWRLPKESKTKKFLTESDSFFTIVQDEKVTFQSCFHPFLQCGNITVVHFLDFHTRHLSIGAKQSSHPWIYPSGSKLCQRC